MAGVVGLAPGAVYPLAYRLSTSFSHFPPLSYNTTGLRHHPPRSRIDTLHLFCMRNAAGHCRRETRPWPRITRREKLLCTKMRRPDYDRIKPRFHSFSSRLINFSTLARRSKLEARSKDYLLIDRIFDSFLLNAFAIQS